MPDQRKEWYTVQEAATYLNVSERTMWRYINQQLIQSSNVNPLGKRRKLLIETHILAGFVASHKMTPDRQKRAYNRSANYKPYTRKSKPTAKSNRRRKLA